MKFDRLDATRGFAAAFVCLSHVVPKFHSLDPIAFPFRFSQEAVMVFFILSGFVICWTTPTDTEWGIYNWKEYFLKRFIRIYSVWFLAVLAMAAIVAITIGRSGFDSLFTVLGNFLMLQDFGYVKPNVICEPIFGDGPLWSLHYEWWFYVMFPIALLVKGVHRRAHIVGCMGILGSILYLIYPIPPFRLLMYFTVWWVGAHAAATLKSDKRVLLSSLTIPLIYVAIVAVPQVLQCGAWIREGKDWSIGVHPFLEARHLLTSILIVLVAFTWRKMNWIGFNASIGLFRVVAPISFSLYVIHFKSLGDATYLNFVGNPGLEFMGYIVLTLLFCLFAELVFFPYVRRLLIPSRRPEIAVDTGY